MKLTKMHLTTKKKSKKMKLNKHTFEKTQACKKHQYKMKILNQTQCSCLFRTKDNKHTT